MHTPVASTSKSSRSLTPTAGSGVQVGHGIPIANIKAIRFGEFEISTWYQAPFPEEFSRTSDGRLWICEFCLKYLKGGFQAERHRVSLRCVRSATTC